MADAVPPDGAEENRPGEAGLKAGDVITGLGGKSVSTASELRAAINARRPGDSVTLTYRRGGQSHTLTVKLASRPA